MIQQIVVKIEDCIANKPLSTYKIDDYFLAKLYCLLLKHCLPHDLIEDLMVAFGLLQLHVTSHGALTSSLAHDDLSATILDGDYFYSLYYQYCATHAFYLIEHDFASVLKTAEINALNSHELSLIDCVMSFLEEGDLNHELLI